MIGSLVSRIACILVGNIYPLYRTLKIIPCLPQKKTVKTATIDGGSVLALKQVVAYWTVFSAFTFAEFFIHFFPITLPLYYESKILFLLWLIHSNFAGAVFFFDNFIDEILAKHEKEIDCGLEKANNSFKRQLSSGLASIADATAKLGVAAFRKALFHNVTVGSLLRFDKKPSRQSIEPDKCGDDDADKEGDDDDAAKEGDDDDADKDGDDDVAHSGIAVSAAVTTAAVTASADTIKTTESSDDDDDFEIFGPVQKPITAVVVPPTKPAPRAAPVAAASGGSSSSSSSDEDFDLFGSARKPVTAAVGGRGGAAARYRW